MIRPELLPLNAMVRGAYDLQQLRIQAGLRLCANFRAKLRIQGPLSIRPDDTDPEATAVKSKDAEEKKEKAIALIKGSYNRLTDGLVSSRGKINVKKINFTGDPIISTPAELALVDQYIALERQEARQFRDLEGFLDGIPIWDNYLKSVVGVGPAMAAVMILAFDIRRARNISSFWKIAGLDVVNNVGRSKREEHLIDHHYIDRHGVPQVRKGVTYNTFLKTKLMGVLATSFLRSGSPWRQEYDNYKHRLQTDPSRKKITVEAWKKAYARRDPELPNLWNPGRIHTASLRYMIKQFLAELWVKWRTLEGLEVTDTYAVAKQGARPHRAA